MAHTDLTPENILQDRANRRFLVPSFVLETVESDRLQYKHEGLKRAIWSTQVHLLGLAHTDLTPENILLLPQVTSPSLFRPFSPDTVELIPNLGAISPPRRARPEPGPHTHKTAQEATNDCASVNCWIIALETRQKSRFCHKFFPSLPRCPRREDIRDGTCPLLSPLLRSNVLSPLLRSNGYPGWDVPL